MKLSPSNLSQTLNASLILDILLYSYNVGHRGHYKSQNALFISIHLHKIMHINIVTLIYFIYSNGRFYMFSQLISFVVTFSDTTY